MKHFPGLYQRASGIYWFTKQVGKKRKFVSLKTKDLQEAIREATKISGCEVVSGSPINELIEPYLQHKKTLKRYTASSIDSKGAILRKFSKFTAGVGAADITPAVVQSFYNEQREGGLSDDTAASYLSTIRAFFKWCVAVRKLRYDNPCENLQVAKVTAKARRDFCPPELVDRLIVNAPNDDLRFILYCGFHAGMRKQEIIESKSFWFDIANRQIHLRKHEGIQFKDGEERTIPLTSQFAAFLKHYGMREPYMLRPEVVKGKSLYRYDFEKAFNNYMAKQGCDWVTTHIMRHTFASLMASERTADGGPANSIFEIAVWLGDGVAVVQKHYAKLLPVKRDVGSAFSVSQPAAGSPPA